MIIDPSRAYDINVSRNKNGIISRVSARYGNVRVSVQGEVDHPQTRRARARKALRQALGNEWDITEYYGYTLMTHENKNGERYGSLHHYGAVKAGD